MPQGSSSHGISANVDLSHQSGVMAVLAAVRASAIPATQKSELRDLVFEFTNGGRDETVRLQLEQKLTAYGVTVAPLSTRGVASARPTEFGTVRPAPSFAPVDFAPTAPPSVPVQPAAVAPSVPAPVAAVPVAPLPPTPPVIAPAPAPAPVMQPPVVQVPVEPAPIPVSPPPAPPVESSAPVAPSEAGEADANLRRIREIKAIVNERVGNPVNLVDIDNTVGREYMSALLEAMKKVNAGAAGVAAMERLETAFVSVQAVLAAHSAPVAPVPQPPVVTPAAQPAAAPVLPPVVEQSVSAPAPILSPTPAPTVVPVKSLDVPPPAPTPLPVDTPAPLQSSVPMPAVVTPPPAPSGFSSVAPEKPTPAPVAPPIPSLADNQTRLKSPLDLPDPAVVSALGPNDDPLMTKEIDAGLEQLLLEWSLFKKSGLFGTGPKGREHPLFKKIATLPIALLLAGRFEGATQEIKQSITDYMNGWRYEQGIVYEQGETFEKYLRRVIKHIVDLQKQRQGK